MDGSLVAWKDGRIPFARLLEARLDVQRFWILESCADGPANAGAFPGGFHVVCSSNELGTLGGVPIVRGFRKRILTKKPCCSAMTLY